MTIASDCFQFYESQTSKGNIDTFESQYCGLLCGVVILFWEVISISKSIVSLVCLALTVDWLADHSELINRKVCILRICASQIFYSK